MPHTQPGGLTRWIIGSLSAAAIIAGVGLLLGDITRRQPPPRFAPAPPGGPPKQGMQEVGSPLAPAFGSVTPGAVALPPLVFSGSDQLWQMTPTTIPLTKLPEGKAFLVSFRTLTQMRMVRYGQRNYPPLPPEELAQIMIETKSQNDRMSSPLSFWSNTRLWQVVRLGDDFYLRAWKLPDGVQPSTGNPTVAPQRAMMGSGMPAHGETAPPRRAVRGTVQVSKGQPELKVTLFNRPDHPDIPAGVKAEPLQIPFETIGGDNFAESSGSHFGRLQLGSLRLDNRAKEKWSSLPLPSVPPEKIFPTAGGRISGGGVQLRAGSPISPVEQRKSAPMRPSN
jgi:hypothetical protein